MDKFDVSSACGDGGLHYTAWHSRVEKGRRRSSGQRQLSAEIERQRGEKPEKMRSTGVGNHRGEATLHQGGWSKMHRGKMAEE
jgi:hypothetical protein